MSKKSKGHKRGSSRTKRAHSSRRRRTHRRRGGADALDGASLKYSLAGSWPSRMSLGQGADYFKYHVGQHGGMGYDSNMGGAPMRAISHSMLPSNLRAAAHINGIDNAIEYSRQFKDPNQAGGRRSRRCKKHGKRHGKKNCKSYRRHRTHKKRGGNMGYAPFPNKGMLLDSPTSYAQAGLNPQWKTDVAFDMAKIRSTQ